MNRIASTGTHFGRTYLHAIQQSCLYACAFVFGIAVFQARVVSAELESGQAFLVGTPDRLGPLALPTLQSWPRGVAYVFDAEQPDLFVRGRGGIPDGLYVFPWLRTSDQGTPVFGRPKQVESEFEDNGTIFQTPDGQIHGVWTSGKNLVHTRLDKEQLKFVEVNRVEISSLPRSPSSVAVRINSDETVTCVLEISDGVSSMPPGPKPRTPDYQPFDGAGIWRGGIPYKFLYKVTLPRLLAGPAGEAELASATEREVPLGMQQLSFANLGLGREQDLVAGSRFGVFSYYRNPAELGVDLAARLDIVDAKHNALRHPTISPAVVAYPNPETGMSDLIAGGEGAVYYYRFSGEFSPQGKPVYHDPTPVLQQDADLYAGSLPVISVVDWNGDGALDVIAGNSEGRVLFFQNLASNESPAFDNAVPIAAGGYEIFVQPGYNQDIQGPQESRWGYTCPRVVDWNEDGLLDILMSDSTARHTVFLNRGSSTEPKLARGEPLYCDGLDLHGMWRVQPAVGKLAGEMVYIIVDGEDHLHMYRRVDDYNVADVGKLHLDDGQPIGTSYMPAGGTGRCKLNLADWDDDGTIDLIIGTSRSNAIPNRQQGYPRPALDAQRSRSNVLWLRNVGSNVAPRYAFPIPLRHADKIIEPAGAHACSPAITPLGGGSTRNLVVGNEAGRLLFFRREEVAP